MSANTCGAGCMQKSRFAYHGHTCFRIAPNLPDSTSDVLSAGCRGVAQPDGRPPADGRARGEREGPDQSEPRSRFRRGAALRADARDMPEIRLLWTEGRRSISRAFLRY
jgi:hypothetical protein